MNSFAVPLIEKKVGALFFKTFLNSHTVREGRVPNYPLLRYTLIGGGMYVPNLSFKTLSFVF